MKDEKLYVSEEEKDARDRKLITKGLCRSLLRDLSKEISPFYHNYLLGPSVRDL
jgi:hypothetical protein